MSVLISINYVSFSTSCIRLKGYFSRKRYLMNTNFEIGEITQSYHMLSMSKTFEIGEITQSYHMLSMSKTIDSDIWLSIIDNRKALATDNRLISIIITSLVLLFVSVTPMGELSLFVIIVQHHNMQHIAENVTFGFGECLSGVTKSLLTSVQLVYNLHCSLVGLWYISIHHKTATRFFFVLYQYFKLAIFKFNSWFSEYFHLISIPVQRCFVSCTLIGRNSHYSCHYAGAFKTCLNPPRGREERRIGTLA